MYVNFGNHRFRPCSKRRLRLQLRLDQRVYQCWRIGRRARSSRSCSRSRRFGHGLIIITWSSQAGRVMVYSRLYFCGTDNSHWVCRKVPWKQFNLTFWWEIKRKTSLIVETFSLNIITTCMLIGKCLPDCGHVWSSASCSLSCYTTLYIVSVQILTHGDWGLFNVHQKLDSMYNNLVAMASRTAIFLLQRFHAVSNSQVGKINSI